MLPAHGAGRRRPGGATLPQARAGAARQRHPARAGAVPPCH